MDGYTCAYRDTKSPLTPIVPLADASFTLEEKKSIKNRYPKFVMLDSNKSQISKNQLSIKSENGILTPFPNIKNTPNYLTPKCHYKYNTPYSNEIVTPKYLTPQNQCIHKLKNIYIDSNNNNINNNSDATSRSSKKILNYDVTPRSHFSDKLQRIRQIAERRNYKIKYSKQKIQLKIENNDVVIEKENINAEMPITKNCHCFKRSSPIQPKELSPRVNKILKDTGLSTYTKLFETEEIDFQVFQMLTLNDLKELGVKSKNDLNKILDAVTFWKNHY